MSDKEKVRGEGVEVVAWRYTNGQRLGGKWHYQERFPKWDDRKVREIGQMDSLMTVAQHQRITEALRGEVERLKAQLAEETQRRFDGNEISSKEHREEVQRLQAQLAQQQVPGWKLVPVEPTPEMVSAAEEAHMPFGDMDIALRMAMLAAPAPVQAEPASPWVAVSERLPESERTVLAFYLNSHGKGRRVRAEYIAAKTKSADDGWDSDEPADYDEQADEYFWPAGWYEVMDNWDDLTHMVIHEGEVTHWMPLPKSPEASK